MNTTLPSAEKFMALLAGSPEVKAVLENEKRQAAESEKQARLECLDRLKNLRDSESEALDKLNQALPAVKVAEAKVQELKTKVAHLSNAYSEASQKRNQASSELIRMHGEGDLQNTLQRLDRLIKDIQANINDLELAKNPYIKTEDGGFTIRPVNPNITPRQKILKERLDTVQSLYATAKQFVMAEKSPMEIKELCSSIREAIGQPMQSAEVTA